MRFLIYIMTHGVAHTVTMILGDEDERSLLAIAREFMNDRGKEDRGMDCE